MHNVLVVGGTGLIGSHIARELHGRGYRVAIMARREPRDRWLAEHTQFVPGDYVARTYPTRVFRRFDRLVYAAGVDWRRKTTEDRWHFFERVNVEAPARLFAAAAKQGVQRAVLGSSYYHAVRPELCSQPYVRSRALAETATFNASGSMTVCAIQPSWVMGPITGMDTSAGETITKLVRSHLPLVAFPGGTNWISARSVAFAAAEALERGRDRARYLLGDENLGWKQVFEAFATASGKPRRAIVPPRSLLALGARAQAWASALMPAKPGWGPTSWMHTMTSEIYFDASEAQRELGYPSHDIGRAIAETYGFCHALLTHGDRDAAAHQTKTAA